PIERLARRQAGPRLTQHHPLLMGARSLPHGQACRAGKCAWPTAISCPSTRRLLMVGGEACIVRVLFSPSPREVPTSSLTISSPLAGAPRAAAGRPRHRAAAARHGARAELRPLAARRAAGPVGKFGRPKARDAQV